MIDRITCLEQEVQDEEQPEHVVRNAEVRTRGDYHSEGDAHTDDAEHQCQRPTESMKYA